jgi:hypothetical protein
MYTESGLRVVVSRATIKGISYDQLNMDPTNREVMSPNNPTTYLLSVVGIMN